MYCACWHGVLSVDSKGRSFTVCFFLVRVQTAKLLTGVSEAQSQVSVDLVRKVWFPIGSAVSGLY